MGCLLAFCSPAAALPLSPLHPMLSLLKTKHPKQTSDFEASLGAYLDALQLPEGVLEGGHLEGLLAAHDFSAARAHLVASGAASWVICCRSALTGGAVGTGCCRPCYGAAASQEGCDTLAGGAFSRPSVGLTVGR